jgi:hypothetical protein
MKRTKLLTAVGLLTVVGVAPVAYAAGLFNGFPVPNGASYCSGYSGYPTSATTPGVNATPNNCNSTVPAGPALTGNEYYPADTAVPGSVQTGQPVTVLVPGSAIAGSTWMNSRNLLGNGAFNGTQVNGTTTVTGATTSAPGTSALGADRWVIDTNVASGTGSSVIATATPTPPAGFINELKLYRAATSSLAQPICAWQAIPNADSVSVAGQTVTLSAYVAALAGLSADNGNTAQLVVITGTGTDQGFNGSWTASPAITPAWTGIATATNTTINVTTTYTRYSVSVAIPSTATEIGVGVCFTPTTTAGNSGTTDGIAFTGTQLERGNVASLYEFKTRVKEVQENQAFVYAIHDTASLAQVIGSCSETTANSVAACFVAFPETMYKSPTTTITGCGTACFAMPTTTGQTAVTSTCVLILNATFTITNGPNGVYLQCTQSGTTAAVGINLPLLYSAAATNSGIIASWTGL